jgi:2-methylcitrate dehydratase PrpD
VLYPKGDPHSPMTWDDVAKKFTSQAEPVLGAALSREIIERAMQIEKESDIRAFAQKLAGV